MRRVLRRLGAYLLSYTPRPHLSAALAHLRFSIFACALVLGIALSGRIVLFAIVHFTDARTTQVGGTEEAPLRVVSTPPRAQITGTPKKAEEIAEAPPRADVNQVPGTSDLMLRRGSIVVQWVGVMSALLLAVLMFQAVMLAGASSVPGVERAVSAGTLAFIVVLCCLPLSGVLPETPFRGVFVAYERLVEDSALVRAGDAAAPTGLSFIGANVLLPSALILALVIAVLRFRSGVEAGVIATSVSELNEKLEREIRSMKTGNLSAPRAVGALNLAIGAQPSEQELRMAAGAESIRVAPPAFRIAGEAPGVDIRPGDSTKRPI